MKTYKVLRKEQIAFPERTESSKTFIDQIPGNEIENENEINVGSLDNTIKKFNAKI